MMVILGLFLACSGASQDIKPAEQTKPNVPLGESETKPAKMRTKSSSTSSKYKDWGTRPAEEEELCWVWDCCQMADLAGKEKTAASSTLPAQGKKNYGLSSLFDDDPRTAWVEGAKGLGIGEYIEMTNWVLMDASADTHRIYLLNGYQASEDIWEDNARIKDLDVSFNGKLVSTVTLDDRMGRLSFEIPKLPDNGRAGTLRFTIKDVYKGRKYEDTAISELWQCGG